MSKKTALEKMSEYIVDLEWSLEPEHEPKPPYCDYKCKHNNDKKVCQKCVIEFFKQQTTIPDGWDVVREIYKEVEKRHLKLTSIRHSIVSAERAEEAYQIKSLIKQKLKQAGIEVSNE